MTRRQNGISPPVPQASFRGKTSSRVMKRRFFFLAHVK